MNIEQPIDILLVDDGDEDAELTIRTLRKNKVNNPIFPVRDGEEPLDFIFGGGRFAYRRGRLPNLIMLDLKMPKIGGIEVLQRLKANPQTAGANADFHGTRWRTMGERVADQIRGDLLHSSQIAADALRDADISQDLPMRLSVLKFFHHGAQARVEIIDGIEFHAESATQATAREIQHIIDERGHPLDVGADARRYVLQGGVGRFAFQEFAGR